MSEPCRFAELHKPRGLPTTLLIQIMLRVSSNYNGFTNVRLIILAVVQTWGCMLLEELASCLRMLSSLCNSSLALLPPNASSDPYAVHARASFLVAARNTRMSCGCFSVWCKHIQYNLWLQF